MELINRLARLDARVIPWLRKPGESAESYLRRAAGLPMLVQGNPFQIKYALREYFDEIDRRA
jgi:hypothetical protein